MTARVKYIQEDVVKAAKKRFRYIANHFDHVVMSFSGGKDSLVSLTLMRQVWKELGRTDKPKVFFFDEEFVAPQTLQFMEKFRTDPELEFLYACLQMESEVAYCGKIDTVIQWGKDRKKWMRPIPEYALTDWETVYDVYSVGIFLSKLFKGKICNVTGVRATESPSRRSMIMSHKNDYPFLHQGKTDNVMNCTPIYDWVTLDVWKFLYDNNIEYNPNYDSQMFARKSVLRVDTPLHAKGQKEVPLLKQIDPEFFAGLTEIFPEIHAAALYNNTLTKGANVDEIINKYERSWRGIVQYIHENITDETQRKQALYWTMSAKSARENAQKKAKWTHTQPFYFYPLYCVFRYVIRKQFDKRIPTTSPKSYSKKYFDYEGLDYDEYCRVWRDKIRNSEYYEVSTEPVAD